MSYIDELRHPKWQKMRLQILERDGFSCTQCGDTEETLDVDHSYYERGLKPWEYPPESLHTLCRTCHEEVGQWRIVIKELLKLVCPAAYSDVAGFLVALLVARGYVPKCNFNDTLVDGMACYFGVQAQDVYSVLRHHETNSHLATDQLVDAHVDSLRMMSEAIYSAGVRTLRTEWAARQVS